MLTKMVNGQVVVLTDQEEANTRLKWHLNDTYPEYQGCLMFDGINAPIHDINQLPRFHKQELDKVASSKLVSLNSAIEDAEDSGDQETAAKLRSQRIAIKAYVKQDTSSFKTVDQFKEHLEQLQNL